MLRGVTIFIAMSENAQRFCALQSVDFSSEELDYSNSSLLIFPFAPSWLPMNISYAAYSIKDTQNSVQASADPDADEKDKLKLWARFIYDTDDNPDNNSTVQLNIRARSVPQKNLDRLEEKMLGDYPGQDVLGEVLPTEVYFKKTGQASRDGESNIPLIISGAKFSELGVGVYDITWDWEYQELEWNEEAQQWLPIVDEWIHFETSMFRIFVTLEIPTNPWTAHPFRNMFQDDYSVCPIWSEAMLWACKWAQGAKTMEEAAKGIADGFLNSGIFKYHPDSQYSRDTIEQNEVKLNLASNTTSFYLSKIIERLEGGNGLGEEVNCVDCSLLVATMTNLLGGNMQVGKLQGTADAVYTTDEDKKANRFEVNTIQAIGSDIEATQKILASDDSYYFTYHTIAWLPSEEAQQAVAIEKPSEEEIREKLNSGEIDLNNFEIPKEATPEFEHPDNLVFDACVNFSVDGTDENVISASGMKINDYREKLATDCQEEGIVKCLPQQETIRTVRIA